MKNVRPSNQKGPLSSREQPIIEEDVSSDRDCQNCLFLKKQHQDLVVELDQKIKEKDDFNINFISIGQLQQHYISIVQLDQNYISFNQLNQHYISIDQHNLKIQTLIKSHNTELNGYKNLSEQYSKIIDEKLKTIQYLESRILSFRATENEQLAKEFRQNNSQATMLSTKRPMLGIFNENYLVFIRQCISQFVDVVPTAISDRKVAFIVQQIFKDCFTFCKQVLIDPLIALIQNMTPQEKQIMENNYFEMMGGKDLKTIVPYQRAYQEFDYIQSLFSNADPNKEQEAKIAFKSLIDGCCNYAWRILLTQPSVEIVNDSYEHFEAFNKDNHISFPSAEILEKGFIDLLVLPQIVSVKDKKIASKALVFLGKSTEEIYMNHFEATYITLKNLVDNHSPIKIINLESSIPPPPPPPPPRTSTQRDRQTQLKNGLSKKDSSSTSLLFKFEEKKDEMDTGNDNNQHGF
ncbi:hypothetical protein DFA_04933 [Cavenderia fasciculata]|uniref:Uncharacterized protein n=1 Tax=Cavenderia fasciculata TaxID=261658 RepID=F4PMF3_CACFS|nr:uncharacterized protein DFA_04933 [Cavenderia fasciculata]EGG22803.1 hypothetical protein DFA_04933 [Cavenderia fasciculata]|eukprot:XP_004360654.1 hypothetical protein DFA_04933 [Cavenderia fasciculata]